MLNITHYQRNAMRYHLTSVKMAIIKKPTSNKRWRRCGEMRTLLQCWWECKLIQPLWRTGWRFLKKLGIKPPRNPAIPLLGIYPEETRIEKRHMHPNAHRSTIYNSQDMKQPRCPVTDKWIKKPWYIYTIDYYSAIKRNAFESVLLR